MQATTSPRSRLLANNATPTHGRAGDAAEGSSAFAAVELAAARRSWNSSSTAGGGGSGEESALLGGFRESPPKAPVAILPADDSVTSGDEEAVVDQSGSGSGRSRAPRSAVNSARPSRREAPPGVALPSCCANLATQPHTDAFLEFRGRFATSYRLDAAPLKSPVDVCLLPNDCLAVADYDNGFLLLSPAGDVLRHHCPLPEGKNACGTPLPIHASRLRGSPSTSLAKLELAIPTVFLRINN